MCNQSKNNQKCFHHVQLHTVHRQEEPDFIMALHEIAGGNISDDSYNLVSRLRRPLPPGPDPVKIYAQNLDVELWNSDCLMKMDGDARLYKAEDTGDKKLLSSVSAQKLLALKKGCPVMLIVNLFDELVNGLTGRVVALHENAVEVYFPSIDHHCTLSAFPFSVYDKDKHIDVACRRQVPLKLCFALTVHKAQGLTLNRLSVDCRSMNQNGHIYVALSRATHKKGLQITNFQKSVLKRPSDNLLDFYLQPQRFPKEDLTCCQASFNYTIGCEDSVQTDYDFLFEPEEFDTEDNEMANFVSFIESYDEENISFCLPESVQVDQIISNISPKFVETKEQRDEMEVIRRLKVSENLFKLFQYFRNAFMIIKENVLQEGKAVSNTVTSEFYREVNQMLISEKTQAITNVFEGDSVAKKNVFYRLSCEVRKGC